MLDKGTKSNVYTSPVSLWTLAKGVEGRVLFSRPAGLRVGLAGVDCLISVTHISVDLKGMHGYPAVYWAYPVDEVDDGFCMYPSPLTIVESLIPSCYFRRRERLFG